MRLCYDLTDWGYLTSAQAMRVLDLQLRSRVPIGKLAVEYNLMTMEQVLDVLSQQFKAIRPFGEIAIEKGYLSRENLGILLLAQIERTTSVKDLIVQEGFLTGEEIEEALQEQRRNLLPELKHQFDELIDSQDGEVYGSV